MHPLHSHQPLTKFLPVPMTKTEKCTLVCHKLAVQPFTNTGTVIANSDTLVYCHYNLDTAHQELTHAA